MKANAHKIIRKTRRGALAFDVADQNRDSQLLPWVYTDQKALDSMFDQIKPIALRRKSTLISAKNAKNILADAEKHRFPAIYIISTRGLPTYKYMRERLILILVRLRLRWGVKRK